MALLNPPNVLERIQEAIRQTRGNDSNFIKNKLYFFELHVPPEVASGVNVPYIYPLVLSPEQISITEPFTVEKQFTNEGGIFVEENGVLAREIRITGTTGFKPKRNSSLQSEFSSINFPGEGKSYSRTTAQFHNSVDRVSGMRHFQFLQDSVFRTYADLKRDPATSEGTELFFHMLKDSEHWRVKPMIFGSTRTASRPLEYPYEFTLLAVGPADQALRGDSEDKSIVDKVNDAFAMIKAGAALIRSAIQDLSGIQNEVRTVALQGSALIGDAASIAGAAEDFVDGTARTVEVPFAFLAQTKALLDNSLSAFQKAVTLGSGPDVPGSAINSLRKLGDGVEMIGSYPEKFSNTVTDAVSSFNTRQELSTSQSRERLAAAAADAPQTLRELRRLGSGLLPGDQLRASEELGLGRAVPRFSSALQRVIEQNDTLASLASRFLGDARQWKYIAIFNDLKAPFISDQGLPGTVGIGDTILIPSTAKPVEAVDIATTQGVNPVTASGAEQVLGTDLKMVPVKGPGGSGRTTYDLAVDVEQGSTDFKVVSGIPNLQQGILSRLLTEKGNDILYHNLGTSRVIGMGLTEVELEIAQFRIVEAVQADPRITGVRRIRILDSEGGATPDAVQVELDAEVRGFNTPLVIQTAEG